MKLNMVLKNLDQREFLFIQKKIMQYSYIFRQYGKLKLFQLKNWARVMYFICIKLEFVIVFTKKIGQ